MGNNINFFDKRKIEAEKCWESGLSTMEACGKAPKSIDVFLSPNAKDKIDKLMSKFESTEWLAYLVGKETTIDDIYIPRQNVTSGSVTNVDSSVCNKMSVIGVIHSHHNMGNSFSSTDDEWINQNHDISLCISKNGINGQVRWKAPCGSLVVVKAIVKLNMNIDYDEKEFEEQIEKNINKTINIVKYVGGNRVSSYVKRSNKPICRSGGYIFSDEDDDFTLKRELEYYRDSGMFDEEDDDEDYEYDLLEKSAFTL